MDSDSRNDRIPILRDQVTRIYMTTVAANEREERLLSKKLDALDLEHRAEYLRMKNKIFKTRQNSKRKLLQGIAIKDLLIKECQSQAPHSGHVVEEDISNEDHITAATTTTEITTTAETTTTAATTTVPVEPNEHGTNSMSIAKDSEGVVIQDKHVLKGESHRRKEKRPNQFSKNADDSESIVHDRDLNNRIKYTESEVKRLKTSWQGRRSPKHARKARTFLPHLANEDSVGSIKTLRKRRSESEEDDSTSNAVKLPDIRTKRMQRNPRGNPRMSDLKRGKTIPTIKELNENSAIGAHTGSQLSSGAHFSVVGRQNSDPLPMVSSKR